MTLDLQAILARSEQAYTWIGEDPNATDGFLPLSVREHFNRDVPALVSHIQHLTAELAAAQQALDVLTREEAR